MDPQLSVPEYLSEFLNWIFDQVKVELIYKNHDEGYETWADLPFLSKYLGDGILFLWDTENMDEEAIRNVVVSMYEICLKYRTSFLPKILKYITDPPTKLRCGIARGAVYSVGNGNDFVGPCINMSARLQKLHSLSFSFARKGINLNELAPAYKKDFVVKKVDIKGIGSEEMICILKKEYNKLERSYKKHFKSI
jgi:hypothetical protein